MNRSSLYQVHFNPRPCQCVESFTCNQMENDSSIPEWEHESVMRVSLDLFTPQLSDYYLCHLKETFESPANKRTIISEFIICALPETSCRKWSMILERPIQISSSKTVFSFSSVSVFYVFWVCLVHYECFRSVKCSIVPTQRAESSKRYLTRQGESQRRDVCLKSVRSKLNACG